MTVIVHLQEDCVLHQTAEHRSYISIHLPNNHLTFISWAGYPIELDQAIGVNRTFIAYDLRIDTDLRQICLNDLGNSCEVTRCGHNDQVSPL